MPNYDISKLLQILQELGPQEIKDVLNTIHRIETYENVYTNITNFIFAKYQNLDFDKIEKIGNIIDEDLSDIGFGERLLVYNKMEEPFISQIFKEYR